MAGNVPEELRYTKDHEWARATGNTVRVGITAHATDQLGDVVFVELPKVGALVEAHKQFGVVESTKAVSELFAPLSGKVVAVNDELVKTPDTLNSDPYGAAWMIDIELSNSKELAELLTPEQYRELTK